MIKSHLNINLFLCIFSSLYTLCGQFWILGKEYANTYGGSWETVWCFNESLGNLACYNVNLSDIVNPHMGFRNNSTMMSMMFVGK